MTDTPPVAQRERHPAALRTVLLVAVCWRFADGALRGALLALGAQTGPVSSFVSWIVLFSLFPVGWLCDRWWSERRAATVGGWLLIASVAAAALGSYSLTVNGSVVLAGLGAVLLRISLPIMVGHAYAADDPRRLPVFIGLEGASSLGILAASLFVKYLGTDSGVWAFACPALSLAAAVWLLRRLPESVNVSDEVQAPIPRGGDTLRVAAQVSLVAAALTGLFFLVPTSWLTGGLTRILYPGMALVFVLAFFIWASGHFTMPSSRMALRAMAIVVAAGVTFWAMHTTALTSIYVRIEVLSLVNLTSLSRVAAALVLLIVWRRVSRTLVPATATAMGFSFVLMAGAFIVAGIIGRGISVEYSPLLVYALAGAGAVMIAAAALNAATALAPGSTKGRMVAVWFLTPTLANPASYLVDAPDNPAIIAPLIVSAALFIAFLFLPGRDIATGGPAYPGLVTARPGRIRKAALALSGAIAIASAG